MIQHQQQYKVLKQIEQKFKNNNSHNCPYQMKKPKVLQATNPPSLSQLKSQKKYPLTPNIKKKPLKQSPSSNKNKQPHPKKSQQPQDYIIINNNIYSANTFTERNNYEQFLHKVKKQKQVQRKSFLIKSQINQDTSSLKKSREHGKRDKVWKKLSPQDFIQTMSLEEKKQIFFKLQQEIRAANSFKPTIPSRIAPQSFQMTKNSQPCSTQSFQNELSQRKRLDSQRQRKEKFTLLQQKLQNHKMQLMFKWQGQIDRLEEMCRNKKITQKQKQTKIAIIQKLKDHKLKILDCTKTLFEKILREDEYEQEHTEQKATKIQAILKSLHSFPSLQNLDEHYIEKEPSIDHLKIKQPQKDISQISPHKNLNIDSSRLQIVEDNRHQAFMNEFKESSWDRNNNRSAQDLKSPLNFLNNSPQKGRFAQFQDHYEIGKQQNDMHPCNPLFFLNQQLVESEHNIAFNKPLFSDMNQKISLKLDLRLDQVIFGQDQYPQCEKEDQSQVKAHEDGQQQLQQFKLQKEHKTIEQPQISKLNFQKPQQIQQLKVQKQPSVQQEQQKQKPIVNGNYSPPKAQKISMSKITFSSQQSKQQTEDDLACKEQPVQKMNINIPMILSRQKMQTLAFQQNRAFRQNLDNHIAFQMGCIELQSLDPSTPPSFHFTTLVDINTYVVGFYEFMMKKYMASMVDNLNIPYGKSAIDKLYSLQTEGFVIEESYNEMNNILSENHFIEYQREIMFTMRKCTQYQTSHNRVIFQAFTKCINVYRPYFDLQGEVFPWIVSEKGITFYQITQDNIEQVFEKSKIKVLQYCTALCGLHPPSEIKNDELSSLMNQKNEQNLTKMIKIQVLEQFQEWKIRSVNFQCLIRMLMANKIYSDIVDEVVGELWQIEMSKADV